MNIALITGASSGLGRQFAIQIDYLSMHQKIRKIDEIWLVARRREQLKELSVTLSTRTRIIPMDVTNDISMIQYHEILQQESPHIQLLVNCAGFGLLGKFKDLDIADQLAMVDVNCKALTKMTYFCIPYMAKGSHIIQLASSAAFLPQPNFAIYAATKSYVLSFSHALSEELRKDEIIVTAVCPGPVNTNFFTIAEKYGSNLAVKKLTMVEAPAVVRAALRAAYRKKTVSVYSPLIKAFHVLTKCMPVKWILYVLRKFK
ncbi:MAG: SDR family NAD(P)-dependent oxidoreductase [Lachnospiraceae bacterium]|nr:SDR family NAD(P)-dependent oxidoreductase [Lachnospiraceae bacterium]